MTENQTEIKKRPERKKLSGKKISVKQLLQKTYTKIECLTPEMQECLGEIEDCFDCIVFGESGHGKTNFVTQLLKELAPLGRIMHILFEEGHGKTVQDLAKRHNLIAIDKGYELVDTCTFDELMYMLNKKKSAKIVVIDSIQYSRFTLEQCTQLKEKFIKGRKKKIIIYISHADGKLPKGTVAKSILYDVNVKVYVKGKIAFIKSRYGNKKNYIVWPEGAKEFWGKKFKTMQTKQIF